MSRTLHDALYHITARGCEGRDFCLNDSDRNDLLDIFGEVSLCLDWGCYAYCLMTNHYHLVLQTSAVNLPEGMRRLSSTFAQRTSPADDYLFEGRFRAHLVEGEAHLMEVVRYVVLNPVRAKLVAHPEEWSWSSYQATIGLSAAPPWFRRGRLLRTFGSTRDRAIARFVEYTRDGRGKPSLRADLRRQRCIESKPPRPLCWYAERFPDRHEAMARAYLSGDYSQRLIARFFGVHHSTVSRWVRRFEAAHATLL